MITLPVVVLQGSKAEPSTALTSKMSKKEEQQADANGTFAALGLEDEDPEVAAETANREAEPRASKKGKKKKVQCPAGASGQLRSEVAGRQGAAGLVNVPCCLPEYAALLELFFMPLG